MENENIHQPTPVLERLHEDFIGIRSYIQKLSAELREQKISKYPIYIAQMQAIDLGRPIQAFEALTLNYHYNVSFLEEFVKKEIVPMEKINIFRESYKHPEKYACFFMVTPMEAGFVYIPFVEENEIY